MAGSWELVAVSRELPKGLLCPIAKDSRIHADRPRHRGPDALLFRHSGPFLLGFGCRFEGIGVLFEVLEAGRENGWWLVAGGWWLVAVSREPSQGLLCPIAKDSRIHADRPRHRGPDALLFGHSRPFLLGLWCRFKEMCACICLRGRGGDFFLR